MTLLLIAAALLVGLEILSTAYQMNLLSGVKNIMASFAGGDGFPVSLYEETVTALEPMGRDVAVHTTGGVQIYNRNGALLNEIQTNFSSPIRVTREGKLLIYDLGGKSLRLYSKTDLLHEEVTEGNIFAADLSKNGRVAVATQTADALSRVVVYSPSMQLQYSWYTAECYLTEIKLSTDGRNFCVAGINAAEDGSLICYLRFHNISSEAELGKVELPDELILEIGWVGSEAVQVVTVDAVYIYDSKGTLLASAAFEQSPTKILLRDTGGVCVAYGDYRQSEGMTLLSYDISLNQIGTIKLDVPLLSLSQNGDDLLLLTRGSLIRTAADFSERTEKATNAFYTAGKGEKIYCFSAQQLDLVDLSDE